MDPTRTPAALQGAAAGTGGYDNDAQQPSGWNGISKTTAHQHALLPPLSPIYKMASQRTGAQAALAANAIMVSSRNSFQTAPVTQASSPSDFTISSQQLSDIVSFDERANPEQVRFLNSKFGGTIGLARVLFTDVDNGLTVVRKDVQSQTQPQRRSSLMAFFTKPKSEFETLKKSGSLTNLLNTEFEPADLEIRRKVFGSNIVPPEKLQSIPSIVLENIKEDPIIKILIIGAIITLIIGAIDGHGWVEGLAILIAVVIVLTITAGNDYSKEKKFKKMLLLQSDKKVKVVRGGKKDLISSWNLMVGDIVELSAGDEIPADGLLAQGTRLVVDESPLTGESIPLKKTAKTPFLFSGCQISEGMGTMLVTAVGPNSSAGQIQTLLNESQSSETVLQLKLRQVAIFIGKIGFAAGIITFLGLSLRHIIWAVQNYSDKVYPVTDLMRFLDFFNVSVTVIVVAVPEGLPLAVTISLAFSMFKMIKDRCFIRHLDASETMGEATVICTDKTGTLTENRMTVVRLLVDSAQINGDGSGDADCIAFVPGCLQPTMPKSVTDLISEAVSVNSTCYLKQNTAESGKSSTPLFIGSATEGSMLVFIQKLGYSYEEIRKGIIKVESGDYLFTSERKRMSVLCEPQIAAGGSHSVPLFRLYTKGASEAVLKLCTHKLDIDGKTISRQTSEHIDFVTSKIESWASEGLRTIVMAYRDFERPLSRAEREDPEEELTFIALIGIKDPVRPLVPEAVRICQKAGVVVRMVTGDNVKTAMKIARECNILPQNAKDDDGEMVLEGPVFRALSISDKRAVAPRLRVLARSSPADKHAFVCLLKDLGEVVAVTGDGTNDAAALKEADVGFAMGVSGTQIAMNASDIILLDDNFVSIVQSIKWGRNVLDAVRKFLQFQLSVNLVAIIITIVGSLVQSESPLNAVQLLWVNLIMDTFGALGLASDLPDASILCKRSHARNEKILSPQMRVYIVIQTAYQVTLLLVLLFYGNEMLTYDTLVYSDNADEKKRWLHTVVFTTFVLLQVANEISARQLDHEVNIFKGFFVNRMFPAMLSIIVVVQVFMVQFAGSFMRTTALGLYEWGVSALIAAMSIPFVVLMRLLINFKRARHHNRRIIATDRVKEIERASQFLRNSRDDILDHNS